MNPRTIYEKQKNIAMANYGIGLHYDLYYWGVKKTWPTLVDLITFVYKVTGQHKSYHVKLEALGMFEKRCK
jgi:5-hydroxyisourate hydrolase-like protein (transthyretin family)